MCFCILKPSIPQRQKRPAVEFRMPTPCDASHRYSARGVVQANSLELPTKPRPKQPNQNSLFIIKIIYCVCLCVCLLQVHGVVNDTIAFVQKVINTELNSATDNPVSFTINSVPCKYLHLCCL